MNPESHAQTSKFDKNDTRGTGVTGDVVVTPLIFPKQ
jgi:hypothetical protein